MALTASSVLLGGCEEVMSSLEDAFETEMTSDVMCIVQFPPQVSGTDFVLSKSSSNFYSKAVFNGTRETVDKAMIDPNARSIDIIKVVKPLTDVKPPAAECGEFKGASFGEQIDYSACILAYAKELQQNYSHEYAVCRGTDWFAGGTQLDGSPDDQVYASIVLVPLAPGETRTRMIETNTWPKTTPEYSELGTFVGNRFGEFLIKYHQERSK